MPSTWYLSALKMMSITCSLKNYSSCGRPGRVNVLSLALLAVIEVGRDNLPRLPRWAYLGFVFEISA